MNEIKPNLPPPPPLPPLSPISCQTSRQTYRGYCRVKLLDLVSTQPGFSMWSYWIVSWIVKPGRTNGGRLYVSSDSSDSIPCRRHIDASFVDVSELGLFVGSAFVGGRLSLVVDGSPVRLKKHVSCDD